MIQCSDPSVVPVEQAVKLRQQADALLRRLLANREQSEQRQVEAGFRDPIKCITGQSALDDAIATTRDMIRRMDLLLDEMNHDLDEAHQPSFSLAGSFGREAS